MSRPRVLLLMFVVLGLALTYAWFETPRQQRVGNGSGPATDESRSDRNGRNQAAHTQIGLDFSGGQKLPYNRPKRDLFRPLYVAPEPVKAVVVPPPKVEPKPVVIALPPPPIIAPVVVPRVTVKPIPQLKVIGSLQKGTSITAFLSTVQGEIYVVKEGSRFADGIMVRELSANQIVVSRGLNDPGVTLTLTDESAGKR